MRSKTYRQEMGQFVSHSVIPEALLEAYCTPDRIRIVDALLQDVPSTLRMYFLHTGCTFYIPDVLSTYRMYFLRTGCSVYIPIHDPVDVRTELTSHTSHDTVTSSISRWHSRQLSGQAGGNRDDVIVATVPIS